MMTCNCGDVVLIEFMFSDGQGSKKRPALVISSQAYNDTRQEIIIAAITSNITRVLYGDTPITHWKPAGLLFPSLVTGIFQTVKKKRVLKILGTLQADDVVEVGNSLAKSLLPLELSC